MSTVAGRTVPRRIVVVGGGIQGTSVAYHLAERIGGDDTTPLFSVTLLEAREVASAASGKGGGFMARSWGDGSPTQQLHRVAFDMYEAMAAELGCASYRKLPVLSVSPGKKGLDAARRDKKLHPILPNWLDGDVGRISALGWGDDTAQITPAEFVHKMLNKHRDRVQVVLGTCEGIESEQVPAGAAAVRKVTGVKYQDQHRVLPADAVVVSAGPWSCSAEDWFDRCVQLPMEGIKSTSIVWKAPISSQSAPAAVDGTALFCGENHQYGTHRK
jgi:glycine/D-amino acid oxidase-like deaminating enzyme